MDTEDGEEEVLKKPVPLVNCSEVLGIQCAYMRCNISSWPKDSTYASISFKLDLNLTTLGEFIFRVLNGLLRSMTSPYNGKALCFHAHPRVFDLSENFYMSGRITMSTLRIRGCLSVHLSVHLSVCLSPVKTNFN